MKNSLISNLYWINHILWDILTFYFKSNHDHDECAFYWSCSKFKCTQEKKTLISKLQYELFSKVIKKQLKDILKDKWINEAYIYRFILYCCTPKALYNHIGGWSLLNHHQCAASTWMMRPQPQDNSASALTTHQLQRERWSQSSGWGLLGGHDW